MRAPCVAVGCGSKTSFSTGRCSKHRRGAGKLFETDCRITLEAPPRMKTFVDLDGITQEIHRTRGHYHRVGGPAIIRRWPNGERSESWFFRGNSHRIDGPAHEGFAADGSSYGGLYTLGGAGMLHPEDFVAALASYPRLRLREEFSYSAYRVLLDEGFSAEQVFGAIASGVRDVDTVRAVIEGAPAEWAKAFEDAG